MRGRLTQHKVELCNGVRKTHRRLQLPTNMSMPAGVSYFVLALAWGRIRWDWFEGGGGVACMRARE